ncbi:hypothetical protein HAX54_024928, partial [Datura stramonium]|nr:hypothetical protein [Datura stramonium]
EQAQEVEDESTPPTKSGIIIWDMPGAREVYEQGLTLTSMLNPKKSIQEEPQTLTDALNRLDEMKRKSYTLPINTVQNPRKGWTRLVFTKCGGKVLTKIVPIRDEQEDKVASESKLADGNEVEQVISANSVKPVFTRDAHDD